MNRLPWWRFLGIPKPERAKSEALGVRSWWVGFLLSVGAVVTSLADSTPIRVNRTVSQVEIPPPVLQFSSSPAVEELFRAHIFQEPLVVVGGEPAAEENSALAAALVAYSKRSGPDDFSALTGFLEQYPQSAWNAALLTDLGLEYYNTAHYSLAIDAWSNAWSLATKVTDAKGAALVQRALGELLRMDSRLGRMDELERLLSSTGNQPLPGQASQRVVDAREALWSMKNRPQTAFRCGPMALRSIRIALGLPGSIDGEIYKSTSTQRGCSLPQVADLSRKIGLNYQMAFRNSGDFVVPSVVHWKVGHYAAMVRKTGGLYELQDPTFGSTTWASKEALEAETSGYFLVASGPIPPGWRTVNEAEGATVWGKGQTAGNDPQHIAKNDLATRGFIPCGQTGGGGGGGPQIVQNGLGMAVAKVHLMDVNLHLSDNPVGYTPPVGPQVKFEFDYNLRDLFQPANFNYGNLGAQWTSDWFTYLTDNPANPLADVNLYVAGGGQRTYTGFDTNTQSYQYQQYDNNLLTRTSTNPISYQLLYGDGSKLIFSQPDGSSSSARNIFLTQEIDPQGNALTFTYDTNLCLVAVQDAIGQVTTLTYGLPSMSITNGGSGQVDGFVPADPFKLTKVTDPFGRTITLNYEPLVVAMNYSLDPNGVLIGNPSYAWGLTSDTDVIGITSRFGYQQIFTTMTEFFSLVNNYVSSLTTPYGTTSFVGGDNGNTRTMDISYPDFSRERIEYYQAYVFDTNLLQFQSDPALSVPTGMKTDNEYLLERDVYYWDRNASALALGDFSKARLYHFCHTESGTLTSGCLESMKPPLEGRIWFDYSGQNASQIIGSNTLPLHIGRVLDDGSTQLYTFAYNRFGNMTNAVDPVGRSLTYIYDTNGIDLLEMRQTRLGQNELLARLTYNAQHRPLSYTGPSGHTTTYTYNSRGQLLTATDPLSHTTTLTYDPNGYLLSVVGPLPGTNDVSTRTYDTFGRIRTITDVSGYAVTLNYDNLNRVTRVTYPDASFSQYSYNLLDCVAYQDRAGRLSSFAYDNLRQLRSVTDPLGRTTYFEWCRCGALQSITDPMGRATSWIMDIEGRHTARQYNDGSQETYVYENTTSRLRQVTDERQQTTVYAYNADDSLSSVAFGNAAVATPGIFFTYDPNYRRLVSVTDGTGTRNYSYNPISSPSALGAGRLAAITGPLPIQTVSYTYDNLGRAVQETVDGVVSTRAIDPVGRISGITNELGAFTFAYDGSSGRLLSETLPNGQTTSIGYGNNLQDFVFQEITHAIGATPLSRFSYSRDIPRGQITAWSQQSGAQSPSLFSFAYDAADQLLSATVTNSGVLVNAFGYSYDPAGNRLTELAGGTTATASYNALNQLSTRANATINSRTNEWDAQHRLTAVNQGNLRTEFAYDGMSRLASIRQLQNGSQVSFRRLVWCNGRICEERDMSGTNVTKRFYPQGVALETGTNAGAYYYTRDHLGSVRELTDAAGNVRSRYTYDPYGRNTKVGGDVDADFGFAGMFWSSEVSLALTHFRAYDPNLGRWLSRDPMDKAEVKQGPNLYSYAANDPVNMVDRSGLAWEPWTIHTMTQLKDRLTPEQYEIVVARFEGRDPVMPWANENPGPEQVEVTPAEEAPTGPGEVIEPGGEIQEVTAVEAEEPPGFVVQEINELEDVELADPLPGSGLLSSAPPPGFSGAFSQFLGAGITVLTMTDCNTVNGIWGLVRQGKGGLLNIYEDQLKQQLEREGLW